MRDYKKDELYPFKKVLSSTQFFDYEKSPATFQTTWVDGFDRKITPAMHVGLAFSELFADRSFDYRTYLKPYKVVKRVVEDMPNVVARFPELPKKQCEVELKCRYGGWGFRATLDGIVPELHDIIENKTGQKVWSQERANYEDQLTFQAWVYWKKFGIPPRKIILNWWNTKSRAIDIKSFKTSRNLPNLKRFQKRVDVVVENLNAGNFTNPIY